MLFQNRRKITAYKSHSYTFSLKQIVLKLKKYQNFFCNSTYLYYICTEISQNQRSVAKKGNDLSNQKLLDFASKVDEAQKYCRQQGLNYNLAAICKVVASQPAPRFYINHFEACKQYRLYRQGRSNIHTDSRRRMYAEIFSRYEHLDAVARASGQRVIMEDLMRRVLEQEAPSFYYEENSALKTYYSVIQRKRTKLL